MFRMTYLFCWLHIQMSVNEERVFLRIIPEGGKNNWRNLEPQSFRVIDDVSRVHYYVKSKIFQPVNSEIHHGIAIWSIAVPCRDRRNGDGLLQVLNKLVFISVNITAMRGVIIKLLFIFRNSDEW